MPRTAKPKLKKDINNEINKDIVELSSIVQDLNKRIANIEYNNVELMKLNNISTSTLNYILATLYIYESVFSEMGVDVSIMRKEIDLVFYSAFNRQNKHKKTIEYENNIIKKINDQLREFQEKVNAT